MSARTILNPPLNNTLNNVPSFVLSYPTNVSISESGNEVASIDIGVTFSTPPTAWSIQPTATLGTVFTFSSFSGSTITGTWTNLNTIGVTIISNVYVIAYGGTLSN
jgi:hypothetical protein